MRPVPAPNIVKYPVVSALITLSVAVTLAWWSKRYDVSSLFESVDIRRGELWRIFTSTLLHADLLHLAFNIYWIWSFGTLIEERFGHFKTLGLILFLAFVGNGAEYAILEGGVGLSGVGYGFFAFLWVLSRHDTSFAGVIDRQTIGMFVAWFFFCIFLTVGGHSIANIAHGVGAAAGAVVARAICAPAHARRYLGLTIAASTVLVLVAVTLARPWINLSKERGYAEGKLGYDLLVAGRNEDSIKWLRDAARMQPQLAVYWYNLGIAYDRLDRHSEALQTFRHAFELEPSNDQYRASSQSDAAPH